MGKNKDKCKDKKGQGKVLGILKVRVMRGINLAVRDVDSSDPYAVVSVGNKKKKTRVVKDNCNPHWNDEFSFKVRDLDTPIKLVRRDVHNCCLIYASQKEFVKCGIVVVQKVYDKDKFTTDDRMGKAEIDIKPYLAARGLGSPDFPPGTKLERVQPTHANCLASESSIVWNYGVITQDMCLRLRKVECGEVDIQIEWVEPPVCSDSDD